MPSDVEMLTDGPDAPPDGLRVDLHTARQSPITVDDSSAPSTPPPPPHALSAAPSTSGLDDAPAPAVAPTSSKEPKEPKKKKAPASARPSSSLGAKPKSAAAANARSPSPSPPPAPARPPLETVRLEITLGGPEAYEVDIAQLSRESGQRAPTPVPAKRDSSDSEGDDEGDGGAGPGAGDDGKHEKKKRRRKKNIAQEYYDVSDPFIDDSELAVDERMYFAQTKQQGFYVSSGQVALLTDNIGINAMLTPPSPPRAPPKKPKSKKVTVLPPAASVAAALSSASLPPLSVSVSVSNANPNGALSASAPASTSTAHKPRSSSHGGGIGVKGESGSGIGIGISIKGKGEDVDADGASASAMDVSMGEAGGSSLKRKSPETDPLSAQGQSHGSASGKKKRKFDLRPFHPELEAMLQALQAAIAKENWETKGRFPQGLKPLLGQVALKAVLLGEYDDNFFSYMPKIFPYNRFTMMKLIKRTIWRDHVTLLQDRSKELLADLAALAQEGFPRAQEEWERAVVAWEKRERLKTDGTGAPSAEGTPAPAPASAGGEDAGNEAAAEREHEHEQDHEQDEHEHEHEHEGDGDVLESENAKDKAGGGGRDAHAHPPPKKYRLTDRMKAIIWQLVCLSNECCRIENEKNQLEGNHQIVSDQGVRKTLYQKIVAAFPKDWVNSGQISREVSVMKKKYEKEQENE
ncbi:hypothetical protein EIP86_006957 [Pleurotus ostreatoroseus]|nr:hypothetical protein EIP86_006957 [Pleurotus ostreatoroseus]